MTKYWLTLIIVAFVTVSQAQTQVYLEDFDNGIPATSTIVDNDGFTPHSSTADFSDAWIALADPFDSTDTIVGSTSYFDPTGTADRWLITPQITLGAYGNFLYWEGRSEDPSFPDGYFIFASRTDTQLSSFTDTLGVVNAELASEWRNDTINLSEFGLDGETVHIAFVNRTFDGFKLYLDSISVYVEDPVGLEEQEILSVDIFPNPTGNRLNFSLLADEVTIWNLSGTQVGSFENVTSISMSDLAEGMYWVSIKKGNALARKKVIKR